MVLETEVAVGLASAVVTFVSFTVNVASKTKEYYRSPDGMLQENHELLSIAESFSRLNADLLSWLEVSPSLNLAPHRNKNNPTGKTNKKGSWALTKSGKPKEKRDSALANALSQFKTDRHRIGLTSAERALIISARRCQRIAVEFIDLLNGLKVHGSHVRWRCFREALNTVWSKEEIEEKLANLGRAREELMLNLLVVTSNRQIAAQKSAQEENQQLSQAILGAIQTSKTQTDGQLTELSKVLNDTRSIDDDQLSNKLDEKLRKNCDDFSHTVLELAEKDNFRRATTLMTHSLDFPQRDHRYKKICKAHQATFNWLFERDNNKAQPWANFVEWLAAQGSAERLYWVAGKAGSGKSTLMRYIVDDARTQDILRQWAGSKDLAIASCFFWNPGKEKLQKSLEGLLRTLLRELLVQIPAIAHAINQWRWQSYEIGATQLPPWTQTELLSAFDAAITESRKFANVCLFIDGLDEFEGNDEARREIINILKQASKSPNVKVCVSSRPWRIFGNAFETHPSLKLEHLTSGDITNYIQDMLINDKGFQSLQQVEPAGCHEIVHELVTKAQGVFLWVYLVIRELIKGLENEDRLSDLQRRLQEMPPDLEDYFAHMMGTLDKFYLEQANQLCQVALQGNRSLSLLTYCFVHEEDPDYAMNLRIRALGDGELRDRLDFMERRLNTLCKGLLEVQRLPGPVTFFSHRVEFLHRTVRDFLQTGVLAQMLMDTREPFDVHIAMCKAFLAEIKGLRFEKEDKEPLFALLEAFMEHAQYWESMHDDCLTALVDELDRTIRTQFEEYVRFGPFNSHWVNHYAVRDVRGVNIFFPRDWDNTFLTLAMWWQLYHYVGEKIVQHPELCRDKQGRPLTDYISFLEDIDQQDKSQLAELKELVQLALLQQADPPRKPSVRMRLMKVFQKSST